MGKHYGEQAIEGVLKMRGEGLTYKEIGVTTARNAELQRQRNEVILRQQERNCYNAERKAKRLENPSRNNDVGRG